MGIMSDAIGLGTKKNILFVTQRVPFPPDKGDKIRTFHQLDYLASRHHVYCACFVDSPTDWKHVETLRQWCRDVAAIRWTRRRGALRGVRGLIGGSSMTGAAYQDLEMTRRIRTWCGDVDFDVATAFSSSMAPYALAAEAPRRVLDLCDVDSMKWLQYAERARGPAAAIYRREGRSLRQFEIQCLSRFDATIVISSRERAILDQPGTHPRLHVLTNGVEIPTAQFARAADCGPTVGFVGVMDYPPNIDGVTWFVESIWPRVRRAIPDANFIIVGRNPTQRVQRLDKANGVRVIGAVSDVQPFLAEMRVAVAPLQVARGLQNKVLEALAMGRPVVATSEVAAGLPVLTTDKIIIEDKAESFANRVLAVLQSDSLCEHLARAGQSAASSQHLWPAILREYERILLGECSWMPPAKAEKRSIAPPENTRQDRRMIGGLVAGLRGRFSRFVR